jgi:formate--tetrahydrofolate ligase
VFGIKGGGTGGGRAQVVPKEPINLHFTGDIHAIGAANNLLAAMVDAHLLHDNPVGLDPHSVTWRRCLEGRTNGAPRETGFDITAASEVMAIVAVAMDYLDLRRRLGAITVGSTFGGQPVTAEQLGAPGAMAALLTDALKPNLVQTLEGRPALVHCGPFANIAHGKNSLLADRLGLKLGDYVVTESGFGADMGFEKFVDIVSRLGGLSPSAVVLVVTIQALKHHGGDPHGGLAALERGAENLAANLAIVRECGLSTVAAVNRFPGDTDEEVALARSLALDAGAVAAEVGRGLRARQGRCDRARTSSSRRVRAGGPGQAPVCARRSDRGQARGRRHAHLRRRRHRALATGHGTGGGVRAPWARTAARLHRQDAPVPLARSGTARGSARIHTAGARAPCLHGRGVAGGRLRNDADDARPSRRARGVPDRRRRRRAHLGPPIGS